MTIKLNATQAYLLNDIARRAMTYRRLLKEVEESTQTSVARNLRGNLNLDAAIMANTEWQQMESSITALYEISNTMSSEELSRVRKIAVTPVSEDGSYIRHWFKEGEEV